MARMATRRSRSRTRAVRTTQAPALTSSACRNATKAACGSGCGVSTVVTETVTLGQEGQRQEDADHGQRVTPARPRGARAARAGA